MKLTLNQFGRSCCVRIHATINPKMIVESSFPLVTDSTSKTAVNTQILDPKASQRRIMNC